MNAFHIAADTVWTEVSPGNWRAVLTERPELMMFTFSFEKGAVGAFQRCTTPDAWCGSGD